MLKISDKHGWDTVKEYADSDLAENSEDATKLRSLISRAAAKKRQSSTPYYRSTQNFKLRNQQSISQNVVSVISVVNYDVTISFSLKFLHLRPILDLRLFVKTFAGVFDGMSTRQLFLCAQTSAYDRQQPFYCPRSAATGYRPGFIPAANVLCHYCGLPGHFAKFCPNSTQIQRRQSPNPQQQTQKPPTDNKQVGYDFHNLKENNEFSTQSETVTVKDKLNESIQFWREVMKPSDFTLNVIHDAYRLEIFELPQRIFLKKNKKRNSKIPKGQTEIVKSRTDKTMANKMKRKTNIEHTTLH